MKPLVHEDFLLESETARELYHGTAKDLPIIDYHCHLSPELMANDHRFRSITEIWLEGDHYKWRAMRANGIPEALCSGDASEFDKFEAWARTVPETLGNPLYHWTAMELRRPFGIEERLGPATARDIFARANDKLKQDAFSAMGLLAQWKVAVVCSTDDPVDSLEPHARLAARKDKKTEVYPTWRPDKALLVEDVAAWTAWLEKLEAAAAVSISTWESLLEALEKRHAFFHERGCRASDHGLERIEAEPGTDAEAAEMFARLRKGRALAAAEAFVFRATLLHRLAILDHARGWVQQFHFGAMRNNNMGLLARFIGMITDSRSFLSYSRHEYFRRLLCNILGEDVRRGRLPDDRQALANLVANVSFFNARDYFGFPLGSAAGEHARAPRRA